MRRGSLHQRIRKHGLRSLHGLAIMLLIGASVQAGAHDLIYRSGFQRVTDAPASDAEAARFLTMATFGPTPADIARLRAVGYREWLEQQLSMPASVQRPAVENVYAGSGASGMGQRTRTEAWMRHAITAPDQLRQRIAWALSQIMVATSQQSKLGNDPVALAEYYDTLARDAAGWYGDDGQYRAGTYPTLLGDVTRTPAMGKMLTFIRNRVGNPALGTFPDENYAREVMQLFSIGLILRNADFSPLLGVNNAPVPTYTQATVAAYAQVFTGWSYRSGFFSNPNGANFSPADYQPMICYPQYHDQVNAKVLLSYSGNYGTDSDAFALPAQNGCEQDLAQGLSIIAHHPNVAPFVSRQLIQRFSSSNPSPAYIARISAVFDDNGAGVYGDIGAVVGAILLDPEARYDAPPLPAPLVFGKPREPLLKLTALLRYYDAKARNDRYAFNNYAAYQQSPLGALSVFNFYLPDYLPPGELGDADLFGPEFQIINESSVFLIANDLLTHVGHYVGAAGSTDSTIELDLESLRLLAADPLALVDQLDHDLLYGSMSVAMRTTLTNLVARLPATDPMRRVTTTLQVLLASPEFAIQK